MTVAYNLRLLHKDGAKFTDLDFSAPVHFGRFEVGEWVTFSEGSNRLMGRVTHHSQEFITRDGVLLACQQTLHVENTGPL